MNYRENYNKWLEDDFFDKDTRKELSEITDEKEIEERFYRDLEFGTGGIRGVMGAGTNRMNKYIIGRATKGLGTYLLNSYGEEACAKRGVVIGYDTRNNSKDFSRVTADVLTGMGIKVYLHSEARPTPQLSFSVKFLNALTIGDNVIIGANSLINKDIPSDSVVAGNPAKVICSLDDYHKKRLNLQFEEAKELAKAYKAATGLIPPQYVFREFVFLFKNEEDEYGKLIEKSYEEILHINGNYNKTIDIYKKRKPMFNSYEDFITASLKE